MEWWQTFFADEYYGRALEQIPEDQTRQQTEFLTALLKERNCRSALDLCCGVGRLTIPLAKAGFEMHGQDLMEPYIARAKSRAEAEGLSIEWAVGDMRSIAFPRTFDAIVDMFSSFGYFDTREEDEKVIEAVSSHLDNGGLFVLEAANTLNIIRNYEPFLVREMGALRVEETRRFDFETQRIESSWKFIEGDRVSERKMSLRLYTPHEILEMFRRHDLLIEESRGDFSGGPLTLDSPRMIYIARKSGGDYVDF